MSEGAKEAFGRLAKDVLGWRGDPAELVTCYGPTYEAALARATNSLRRDVMERAQRLSVALAEHHSGKMLSRFRTGELKIEADRIQAGLRFLLEPQFDPQVQAELDAYEDAHETAGAKDAPGGR